METRDQTTGPILEAFELFRECWRVFFYEHSRSRTNALLGLRHHLLRDRIVWSTGSVINLFPNTHFKQEDFRCWQQTLEDAWKEDWYNVGADLYEAMSKTNVELANVKSTEYKSAPCGTES